MKLKNKLILLSLFSLFLILSVSIASAEEINHDDDLDVDSMSVDGELTSLLKEPAQGLVLQIPLTGMMHYQRPVQVTQSSLQTVHIIMSRWTYYIIST